MKITISGWAGAGSTALALLLANSLKFKLIQGGEVFRYLYKNIGFETKGADRNRAHEAVEPYFGPLFDEYIDNYLRQDQSEHSIIESDIASFRIGKKSDILSIFLKASKEVRAKRTQGDGRGEDGEVMEQIDKVHRDIYFELHGVDVLNEKEISDTHALVIDNSDMSLSAELDLVVKEIPQYIKDFDTTSVTQISKELEKDYWAKGKDYFKDELRKNNLIPSPADTLKTIREALPEQFEKLPIELKDLILKISS